MKNKRRINNTKEYSYTMASSTHQDLAGFIWNITNKLRGPYRPPQYRHVMVPMTILRRLDLVLEPTKEPMLAELKRLQAKGMTGLRSKPPSQKLPTAVTANRRSTTPAPSPSRNCLGMLPILPTTSSPTSEDFRHVCATSSKNSSLAICCSELLINDEEIGNPVKPLQVSLTEKPHKSTN